MAAVAVLDARHAPFRYNCKMWTRKFQAAVVCVNRLVLLSLCCSCGLEMWNSCAVWWCRYSSKYLYTMSGAVCRICCLQIEKVCYCI